MFSSLNPQGVLHMDKLEERQGVSSVGRVIFWHLPTHIQLAWIHSESDSSGARLPFRFRLDRTRKRTCWGLGGPLCCGLGPLERNSWSRASRAERSGGKQGLRTPSPGSPHPASYSLLACPRSPEKVECFGLLTFLVSGVLQIYKCICFILYYYLLMYIRLYC